MTVPYPTLQKVEADMAPQTREKPAAATRNVGLEAAASISPEFHVRGMRVDEALLELDRYMDEARLAGLHNVRIVHGKGTGALRDLVHRYLREQNDVRGFRLGQDGEGGTGVTVVDLA